MSYYFTANSNFVYHNGRKIIFGSLAVGIQYDTTIFVSNPGVCNFGASSVVDIPFRALSATQRKEDPSLRNLPLVAYCHWNCFGYCEYVPFCNDSIHFLPHPVWLLLLCFSQ